MKLTTGIYISILLAGTALGQQAPNQQASSPSWFDSLRAKLGMSSQPKPAVPANTNNAKPATPANGKPSPAQAQSGKPAANTATAAKPQTVTPNAKPAISANMASTPAPNKTATALAAKNAAASRPVSTQPVKAQAASVTPSAKTTNNTQTAKAQPAQSAQIQPVKAQAGKATSVPVVAAQKPASANIKVAKTAVAANAAKPADAKSPAPAPQKETAINKAAEAIKDAKAADNKGQVAVEDSKTAANTKSTTKEFSYTGQRDPFISPVRTGTTGSGCSTGKRCLAIDQINLKGVIKSDGGMIAVVTNALDKAYFLRENDPVFNGYVLKITGDSVVFSETYEDKLGKPLTREVTKKLTTPAV